MTLPRGWWVIDVFPFYKSHYIRSDMQPYVEYGFRIWQNFGSKVFVTDLPKIQSSGHTYVRCVLVVVYGL